jgi:nucleotide-binding universal stress UspA family protein
MSQSILVAYDATPAGEAALDRALDIAARDGLRLHILSVAETVDIETHIRVDREMTHLATVLATLRARALASGIEVTVQVAEGAAALVIPEIARKQQARLIVIGHRHRGLVYRMAEMSVAKRVLDRAPCEVLVVSAEAEAAAQDPVTLHT